MSKTKVFTERVEPFALTKELKERLYKHLEETELSKAVVMRRALTQYLEKVGA
jgi:predicted DNA-binding protein